MPLGGIKRAIAVQRLEHCAAARGPTMTMMSLLGRLAMGVAPFLPAHPRMQVLILDKSDVDSSEALKSSSVGPVI
jgi:hypothetical protein